MSEQTEAPRSPADELRHLREKAIERVLANVDKDGWSISIAYAHSPTGQLIVIVSDSFDENEPEPKDPRADLKKRAESIEFNLRRMISRGQLRAFAFARNLSIAMESPAGPVQKKAVKVIQDHEGAKGSIAYLVYDPNNGKAKAVELFYNPLEDRYFPEGGWPADKPREPLVDEPVRRDGNV